MCTTCGRQWLLVRDVHVGDIVCLPKLPDVHMKVWSCNQDTVTLESTDGLEFYENYDAKQFNKAGYVKV
jgi:hypothetical protein